jgi:hypothetical protein
VRTYTNHEQSIYYYCIGQSQRSHGEWAAAGFGRVLHY